MMYAAVIKMACRIIKKHALTVPFDLDELVSKYADLKYMPIPIGGVDGTCVHLKTPGKRTKVIVNTNAPRTRQKFTLAHELGHIIIPWHCGTIVDDVQAMNPNDQSRYAQIEREANYFASELLMPYDWMLSLYKQNPDREYLSTQLCIHCGVSEEAAQIRVGAVIYEFEKIILPVELVQERLQAGGDLADIQDQLIRETGLSAGKVAGRMLEYCKGRVAFCVESKGVVQDSGCTRKVYGDLQGIGLEFIQKPFPYYQHYTVLKFQEQNTHWWVLDMHFEIKSDDRSWREILSRIAEDIMPEQGPIAFKARINGILAGGNGAWQKKIAANNMDAFIDDSIQRLNKPEFDDFVHHPDFLAFMRKRAEAFFGVS